MRKNAIRKILHGILDLLPLLVIPTFMIYARNENSTFGSEVTVDISKAVDINQKAVAETGVQFGVTRTRDSVNISSGVLNGLCSGGYINITTPYYITLNHAYAIRCYIDNINGSLLYGFLNAYHGTHAVNETYVYRVTSFSGTSTGLTGCNGVNFENTSFTCEIYDLTLMFGLGNEPTAQEFDTYFPYVTPYTSSQNFVIENYSSVTYNDTDIGSQMVYVLYNTVDKYFNMNNVFGMKDVYNWFQYNIFGGTSPLAIYIVWNIVLYEFVMDLLMLLYGLFMWFIDMIKSLMEKPINAIK